MTKLARTVTFMLEKADETEEEFFEIDPSDIVRWGRLIADETFWSTDDDNIPALD